MLKKIAKALIICLILSISVSASATTVERIVATVNGKAITLMELEEGVKSYGPDIRKEGITARSSVRARALDMMIDDIIFQEALEKSDIKVEENEIDTYIDDMLRMTRMTSDAFDKELNKRQMSMNEYRQTIKNELKKNKYIGRNISPKISSTEKELRQYFSQHMDDFKSMSSIKIAQMVIPFTPTTTPADFEKMQTLAITLHGKASQTNDLKALAEQYSGKPYAVHGGELGVVKFTDLQPNVAQSILDLDKGKVGNPVLINTGIVIPKVLDRAKTSPKDFDILRDKISDAIYQTKLQAALVSYVKNIRRTSDIRIKSLGMN